MPFVFGEVDATAKPDLSFPPKRRQVLLHDHAGTGFPSWVPLVNGGAPAGVVSFNGHGLELISPDVATGTPNGQMFGASALNRLTRPAGVGRAGGFNRVYLEFEWYARIFRSASNVFQASKGFEFGIDTADWGVYNAGGGGTGGLEPVVGNRTLAMVRCCMFDESNTTYYGGKWQITNGAAGSPSFIDLTDNSGNLVSPTVSGYEPLQVGMNYGKWVRQYTEIVFDLTGGGVSGATSAVLEGLRHNGVGFGSLSQGPTGYTTPTGAIPRTQEFLKPGFVPAQSTDAGFQGGMNVYAQIDNRSTQQSKAKLVIARSRVVAF